MSDLFEDKVIRPFVDSYLHSRTPNPCVECNRSVKFGYLLALAEAWGAETLATGHYARAVSGKLFRAKDLKKDQTYFLYNLTPKELKHVQFPVGELLKSQVRERARQLGLKTADKPESQEICFVPRKDYRGFIESRLESAAALIPGPIRDHSGREVGRHRGLASYTIGQRKGLGSLAAQPRYVIRMEPQTNTLVVGGPEETLCSFFTAAAVSWTSGRIPQELAAEVRIRHRHAPALARIVPDGGQRVSVQFEAPQRAVSAGQSAVFYQGEEVLGGGIICAPR
ncbi:MAG: tRNA 2-thiouridine(34) synthase MnmA [Elusimicrobia bacterium RIFCSPHIGHO2_02_FULL_57_9]|nr:MAG: tRNA 2-thiouridine(34) synthase MnmA [Elusimicrobia bacterium RIFCSPHIGHO2_02_FULL_57_9]